MRPCFDHNKRWPAEQMQNKAATKMLLRSRRSFSHKSHFLFSTSVAANQFWHQAISFWAWRQQRVENSGKHNRGQRRVQNLRILIPKLETYWICAILVRQLFGEQLAVDAHYIKTVCNPEPLEIINLRWRKQWESTRIPQSWKCAGRWRRRRGVEH